MSSDDRTLLRRLVAAWRETRDPELEVHLDKLGAQVGDEVERLLAPKWSSSVRDALERVRALAAIPPDPRISARVAAVARTYTSGDSRTLHHAIAELLRRAPSTRLLPAIDAIEVARGEMTRAIYGDLRHAIAATSTTPADPALLAAAIARLGDEADLDALFAQHTANPDDLALRAVLADRLQQAGDPRGELIALQLADTSRARRKAARLLAEHADALTGPLPGVARASRRFARGFLVAAEVVLSPQLGRALARPEWATIEELSVIGDEGEVVELVARMPLLRRFAGPRWAIEAIAEAGESETLEVIVALDEDVRPSPVAFPKVTVMFGPRFAERARTIAALERQALAAGHVAIGHTNMPIDELSAVVRTRRIEQRFAFGDRPQSLALPGWLARVDAELPIAELAFGAGRRNLNRVREVVNQLRAAGITEIAIASTSATPRVRGQLKGVVGITYVDREVDLYSSRSLARTK